MIYIPTIGLEIHIELKTNSKMFCCCQNDSNETKPNQNICEVCTAQPGTLPTANEVAIKQLLKTAMALNCEVCDLNRFERKNYFYPDLPKGYQISQYELPMSKNGYLAIALNEKETKKIRIERIH
ncbi:MAG: Asp-tRNA(Asn)/Glu-tRNA(Gln) amidotransferase subunit GatB, partial [bacterium]|nr:Asp-tRNA(Asn)/Glu-tRNA(Gln) amidotransferase subunit GatB [bacterium]